MNKLSFPLLLVSLFSCQLSKSTGESTVSWTSLWNGNDLSGWHSYLGTPFNSDVDSSGNPVDAFGVDRDPLEVFKVVETEEGNAIRISGVAWGMIYTQEEFANYHLKLKIKWGKDMHPPRENGPRDSGLLYHGFGEPGSAGPWMSSQELQIQQGDMGDYWPVGEVEIDIPSVPFDERYFQYQEGAPLRTYYYADILETDSQDSLAKRRVFKAFNAENPYGEWNEVDLVVIGDSSIHVVNGKVVMRLFNSRRMSDKVPLHSGKIILQSEGAEVFYKDIYIKEITEIPEEFR